MTGVLTFTLIGAVSWVRLRQDAAEQGSAVAQMSRQQIATRLDAEARLAEARLNILFNEANRQTRYLSQRLDIVKAVASSNTVAIEAILAPASATGELHAVLVANATGTVTGASRAMDLLAASEAMEKLGLKPAILSVFDDNRRNDPRAIYATYRIPEGFTQALEMPKGRTIAHLAIEPVFDDFGDVTGALIGLRTLAPSERTFESFAGIVGAGVVVFDSNRIVSAGGPISLQLTPMSDTRGNHLIVDESSKRVARCVASLLGLRICAHVEASEVEETQREMLAISERQAHSLFRWFLILAAVSLGVLVGVVLLSVRRVTRGLPQLASAATSVTHGDLEIPFTATGIGEVRSLGLAFEVMLSNLRESLGRIGQLAFVDQVTGLSNREKMRLDGSAALASDDGRLAFLFLDLDRFKAINDSFGHKTGDMLLRQLASRLSHFFERRQQSGEIDRFWLGRLGGDEFLIIVGSAGGADAARDCTEALIRRLDAVYVIGSAHMTVGTSIGIAMSGQDGRDYDDLLIKADMAMYQAKRQGRGSYAFFTAQAADAMQERLTIEQDLRAALKQGALHVSYQPMVSLADGAVEAAEALVRWTHPERGDIAPSRFIGIAEDAGLIRELGLFVLTRAVNEARDLAAAGTPIRIAVNVSVLQMEDPTFSSTVQALLTEAGLAPSLLELEITETVAMRSSHLVQQQLSQLRSSGIRFAIDDFGTGYSNLSSLARLRVDTLKIDRSLVHDVATSPEQQAIVRTILSLARALGFSTVVEGVEKIADLNFMIDEGANVAQGYYFSPALPIAEFKSFLSLRRLKTFANVSKIFVNRPKQVERNKYHAR
ncbi:diguanylate cyclase [Bosea sp. PAMC 26642]|nr:diguanylate cyclase [Bosea sp. PAMC 26642]